jgi:parallel beta-helix repeat protein
VALACTNGVASEIALDTKYVGNTMVDLSWDEYKRTDFSKYELCRDGVPIKTITDRTVTFYRDTGLTKGVTYSYEIRVYTATGGLVHTCTTSAKAGDVHGEITIDTSWTAASSPYDLTRSVYVHNGATLTIEKGVMVTTLTSVDWYEGIVVGSRVGDQSPLKKEALYADGVSFYDVGVEIRGHAEIKNCFFEDASIIVWNSNNHVITGNTVLNNSEIPGIFLENSSNNVITGNTASNNSYFGIFLWNSSNNVITGNTASNNSYSGILLWNSSNNVITGNTASNNSDSGILLENSSNNKIYNNYFNNTNNAYDNGNNTWSDPDKGPNIVGGPYIGGNYWSDYNGTDSGRDMFGDTELPYNCSGRIKNGGDFNPLIPIRSYIVTTANNQVGEHYLWGAEGQIPDDGGEVIMARECRDLYIVRPAYHTAQETTEGEHYCSGRHSEVTGLTPGNPDNKTHQANYRKYSWQRYDWRCNDWVYGEACEGHRHFDCSGLVYFVYDQAGVPLVRTTAAGYASMDTDIARTDLKPGDVCYRGTPKTHIGIYVGGNRITHAAGHDKGVITTQLDNSWNGFGRLLPLLPPELDP